MIKFCRYSKIISFFAIIGGVLFFLMPVKALDFTIPPFRDLNYLGSYVSQSVNDPITIKVGETKEVIVKIKNTGKTIWYPTGVNFVSAYTVDPNYRESVFVSANWIKKNQPAKITAVTKPSDIAEIKINLTAPSKTGDYVEKFYLAAENLTWIKSSYFYLKIKVIDVGVSVVQAQPSVYKFTRDLEAGIVGNDVKELQKYLNNNGFIVSVSGVGSVGKETTLFGALTKNALIKFQIANKISPAIGYFGPLTRNMVNKKIATPVTVVSESEENPVGNSALGGQDVAQEINTEYQANLAVMSARNIQTNGGDLIRFSVRYINDGTETWNNYLWQEAGSSKDDSSTSSEKIIVADPSWLTENKIFTKNEAVLPKQPMQVDFYFRAPITKGKYTVRFQLTANGHTLDGGTLELPVEVLIDAPAGYQMPIFSSARKLIDEPRIRVGLYKADVPVEFRSSFAYQVYAGEILKGVLFPNELVTLQYADGLYAFLGGNLDFNVREAIRMVPLETDNYFELVNYSRKVSWKGSKNFNLYRGVMEYKYSPKSDVPWVVNELQLDDYIAGIGETSNGAAMEYIKAILVAARSYAYYHINNGVPADQRTFDVYATTADQLYLGYNSEVIGPRIVQAERATRGEMVTYNNQPVVTPYFGHSDGRTRIWSQVWGGADKPWLQSVVCKYDSGAMFGHGVGMSAGDAASRADKDGWTYDQLLKYYYTGVQVDKIY
ncbi:MAG: hypothetical protein COU29_02450 [Candidatus Magasanikbacteria bacterium CG10_big_fil_rev_8_21_14_0_10_36_32]|uniref:Sporulation stage II protein D amidase enhancer LytB N-terminal domain-containing protein n=1 Tax=Candidatus Magasanikbacteria bacterium CG10_big_fil_rev_8_21_14_0_10_36_32 TaxID=1974646 RepID=A0A2M6W752_9BACT|nr:MAG: hypothetical protein COU29_02450 [Candidatus Magasanikbacteria bacterium CG10_big_fil_rev_8_21_14_0_10_36_32]